MARTYHMWKQARGKPTCLRVSEFKRRRKASKIKLRMQYRALRAWGGHK